MNPKAGKAGKPRVGSETDHGCIAESSRTNEALHKPENGFIDFQRLADLRFMAREQAQLPDSASKPHLVYWEAEARNTKWGATPPFQRKFLSVHQRVFRSFRTDNQGGIECRFSGATDEAACQ